MNNASQRAGEFIANSPAKEHKLARSLAGESGTISGKFFESELVKSGTWSGPRAVARPGAPLHQLGIQKICPTTMHVDDDDHDDEGNGKESQFRI